MRVTSPPSVTLLVLVELVATVRADISLGVHILAAFWAGKGKLSAAVGTGLVLETKRGPAVGTQVYTAGWALLVRLSDFFSAVTAKGSPLDPRSGPRFGLALHDVGLILKAVVHVRAAVRAYSGVGCDLFVALGTIEAEFRTAVRADRARGIHGCPAFGAVVCVSPLNRVAGSLFRHRFIFLV